MSLINDALRRASSATPASAVPPVIPGAGAPPPLPPLTQNFSEPELPPLHEPVETPKSKLPIILVALFLFCAAGATVIYLKERKERAAKATVPTVAAKELATANAAPTASAPVAVSAPTPATVQPAPVAAPAQASADAATAKPVQFPPLRLQSIFFKPSNPSVMINGRTLYLNDQIQGVTVAAIDPSSVTLALSGQTNVLTLR
jgi:hypothetical protein